MIKLLKNDLKTGISFLEILVTLLLMSLLMTFAMPRFFSSQPSKTKKVFFADFSKLVTDTAHQAIMNDKIHQIFWDFNKRTISVKIFDPAIESSNKHERFKPTDASVFKTHMSIPTEFTINNFFINEKESVTSGKLNTVFHYIMPDGTAQPVIANIVNDNDTVNPRFCIQIDPFYSQVSLHDTFQKP
jgi:hypothetical protein